MFSRSSLLVALAATLPLAAQPGPEPHTTTTSTQPAVDKEKHVYVKLETSLGDIVLDLDAERAPVTVQNFVDYVEAGFYNGTIFHRVIHNFMIQGGGYTPDLREKSEGLRAPIKNEWRNGLKNTRGSIAMARLGGQADSATAQFFINVVDNPFLDQPRDGAGYAVFGRVISGLDTVDKIRTTPVKTDPRLPMGQVVPIEPVIIKNARRLSADEARQAAQQAATEAEQSAAAARATVEKQLQETIERIERQTGKKFTRTSSGLLYLISEEGTGGQPTLNDTIEAHYALMLPDGRKLQSSHDSGKPLVSPLKRLIPGWQEALVLMKVGSKATLIVPPDLAYGAKPPPGSGIPANATLVFEMELLGIPTPPVP